MMRTRLSAARLVPLLILAAGMVGGAVFAVPRAVQRSRDDALFAAILQRDVATVRHLLKAGANPNEPHTVRRYHETGGGLGVRALRFVWPQRFDRKGVITIFPLDAALPSHNADETDLVKERDARRRLILGLMLAQGANPNTQGPDQNPPLFRAVSHGDAEAVRTLLNCGANPNKKGTLPSDDFEVNGDTTPTGSWCNPVMPQEETPLMCAAQQGSNTLVVALLARRADPNVADDYGRTALHYAVGIPNQARNRMIVVRALFAAGANPSAKAQKWLMGTPFAATPAAYARWSRKRYADLMDESDKKNPRDFLETLRLLDAAEARRKRPAKK